MLHLQAIFQCTIRILEVAYAIACEPYEEESISLKLFPLLGKKLISSFQCDDQHMDHLHFAIIFLVEHSWIIQFCEIFTQDLREFVLELE